MFDKTESLLDSNLPSKRARKVLLDAAESLLTLQNSVETKFPDLIPDECSHHYMYRIGAESSHNQIVYETASRHNMRVRIFEEAGASIPLSTTKKFSTPQLRRAKFWLTLKRKKKTSKVSAYKMLYAL